MGLGARRRFPNSCAGRTCWIWGRWSPRRARGGGGATLCTARRCPPASAETRQFKTLYQENFASIETRVLWKLLLKVQKYHHYHHTWKTVPGEAALVRRVSQTRAHPCTSRSRSWRFIINIFIVNINTVIDIIISIIITEFYHYHQEHILHISILLHNLCCCWYNHYHHCQTLISSASSSMSDINIISIIIIVIITDERALCMICV